MKKYFFCLTFGLFVAMGVCNAQTPKVTPLEFKETVDNNGSGGEGDRPKGDCNISPFVALLGRTLFIYEGCDDTTLRLIDGSDNVAFTQYITTGTTQVVLPSTLSGTYELQIIRGQYLFYTEIEL